MTNEPLLEHPKVKQTLTQSDEKYWYPFGYKLERHSITCMACGRNTISTSIYKVFAHYLYSPHTSVHKMIPVGGYNIDPLLPIHLVEVRSIAPVCGECYKQHAVTFNNDTDWRAFLRSEASKRTQEARRDNQLREIFGGPPARKASPSTQAAPKVSLSDFLKDI